MNYYGRILDDARIDAATAGSIIRQALSALYRRRSVSRRLRLEQSRRRLCRSVRNGNVTHLAPGVGKIRIAGAEA